MMARAWGSVRADVSQRRPRLCWAARFLRGRLGPSGLIGLDEGRRIRSLLFKFGDARESRSELLPQRRDLRGEGGILGLEVGKLITQRHADEYTSRLGEV